MRIEIEKAKEFSVQASFLLDKIKRKNFSEIEKETSENEFNKREIKKVTKVGIMPKPTVLTLQRMV